MRFVFLAVVGIVSACSIERVTYIGLDGKGTGIDAGLDAGMSISLRGTVTGLAGTGLALSDGGETLAIANNGGFAFTVLVPRGAPYNVTVATQPARPAQQCTVANGSGTAGDSDVTNIAVTCPASWSPTMFPIALTGTTNAIGDIALDGNGDLLVAQATPHAVWRVDHATGATTKIAPSVGSTDGSTFLVGVAYRAANDAIYAATERAIYKLSATGAILVTQSVSGINAITVAPAGFGNFGGFLIGVTQTNAIAINPDTGATTTFATTGLASDLVFAPDGTLYVSGGKLVQKVGADGTVSKLVDTLNSADGITITADGQRIFIADSGTHSVVQIAVPAFTTSTFATDVNIDGGIGVGGIGAAPGNTLIVLTNPNDTLVGFAD